MKGFPTIDKRRNNMQTMVLRIADTIFCPLDASVSAIETADTVTTDLDWTDIRDSIDGDNEAYARLVGRYQRHVFQQMWRFTRDVHDQDELVQEVFVEVYRSLVKFRGDAPFLHWLRRIATRVGYRYWRSQSRRQKLQDALERDYVAQTFTGDASASEAAEMLHAMLSRLPASERLILTLMYFENCSSAEIAERMGWSSTLVRVQAFRARKKLKRMLDDAGLGRK
jgi:RNA polymerase sigma-70 factor (ECF subfamily)